MYALYLHRNKINFIRPIMLPDGGKFNFVPAFDSEGGSFGLSGQHDSSTEPSVLSFQKEDANGTRFLLHLDDDGNISLPHDLKIK